MSTTPAGGGDSGKLSRRRFLEAGSVVAVTPLLSAFGSAPATAAEAAAPSMSVGYLSNSESFAELRRVGWEELQSVRVVPAVSLPSGDHSLASAARLRVLGLYPEPTPAQRRASFERAHLDVLLNVADAGIVSFHAWSSGPRRLANPGRRSAFVVPVGSSLDLLMEIIGRAREDGTAPESEVVRRAASFTPARAPERPRLRRGVYLLGLGPKTWARPVVLDPAAPPPEHLSLVLSVDHVAS